MNACVKTGANVYLPEYGFTVHGDLFNIGDVYILNCSRAWRDCMVETGMHANICAYHFHECGSQVIAFEADDAGDFSYEGFEL